MDAEVEGVGICVMVAETFLKEGDKGIEDEVLEQGHTDIDTALGRENTNYFIEVGDYT